MIECAWVYEVKILDLMCSVQCKDNTVQLHVVFSL